MQSPLPDWDAWDALRDSFVPEIALDQRAVVKALAALTRSMIARAGDAPPRALAWLAVAEQWLEGRATHAAVSDSRTAMIDDTLAGLCHDTPLRELLYDMAGGILNIATYEDHADWPEEVVMPATQILLLLGSTPTGAVHEVGALLAEHGIVPSQG